AFLLIDEPTNHRDEDGRQMLASYLSSKEGFLLVSHDRRLLDACTDHTMAIERSSIRIYKGRVETWQREQGLRDGVELVQSGQLDACAARTMAVERSSLGIYKGSVQTWQREKRLRDQAELEHNQKLKKEIRHLEAAASEARRGAGKKQKEQIGHKVGGLKPDR